ncbi:hypothetical protein GA0070616_0017 [Micromonospora nigra]|uniref:Transcriptional regulator, AlpA family n=1 Tax=Micromonospora nigra TaxID=145857 RepID=A0A1C6R704_9ACTN|nr:hypothetical protein [Micromonospora nigra]SCL12789.1 hypothetical protein GA0070616_0017 [Micromonospora nigra]
MSEQGRPAEPEWTTEQVLAWLAEQGRKISRDTWHGYVSRGQAPKPARHVGRTPVWDPGAVERWHAAARRTRAS